MIYNVVVGYTYRGQGGMSCEDKVNTIISAKNDEEAVKDGVKYAHFYVSQYKELGQEINLAYVMIYTTKIEKILPDGRPDTNLHYNRIYFWQIDKALKPSPQGLCLEPIDEFTERWLKAEKKSDVNCH